MKLEVTVKWGVAHSVTYTVYNSWSTDQVYDLLRKIQELIGFNK